MRVATPQSKDLTCRFQDGHFVPAHTGVVAPDASHPQRWYCTSIAAVVRYQVHDLGLNCNYFFFSLRVRLGGDNARVTDLSLVNGAVTDGQLWHVSFDDAQSTHHLCGIIRYDGDSLTLYVNTNGIGTIHFEVEELRLWPVTDTPTQIAVVVDPWVERSQPEWKQDYIWWFLDLLDRLAQAGAAFTPHFVVGEGHRAMLAREQARIECLGGTFSVVSLADLSAISPSMREGVRLQRAAQIYPHELHRAAAIVDLYRRHLPPDTALVLSTSENQRLKEALPDATILFRDAIYCRAPFPDELTNFDHVGLYHQSSLGELCSGTAPRDLPASVVSRFLPKDPTIAALLAQHGLDGAPFLLLPLQDSSHYNFFDEGPFHDQADLLIAAASRFPAYRVVVTQHPDKQEMSPGQIQSLATLLPNVCTLPAIAGLPNLSARLLPFAHGLIALSTGLIYQAILCDVPVHFMGHHALKNVLTTTSRSSEAAWHLLTRVFYSYAYLHNGRWFWSRLLTHDLYRAGALPKTAFTIDMPDALFGRLEAAYRPIAVQCLSALPAAPRRIFLGNDTSGGHAGSRAVMYGLEHAISRAGGAITGRHICGSSDIDFGAIKEAELVIINGEGSFHDDTTDAHALAKLMEACRTAGRPYWLVNCTVQRLSHYFGALLRDAARVITREAYSFAIAQSLHCSPEIRVDYCVEAPFPRQRTDQPRDGIAVGSIHPESPAHRLADMIAQIPFASRVALEFPYDGRCFGDIVAELSRYACYVTGQYHGIYAAILAETPIVPVVSNTHKIEGLFAWAGVDIPFLNPSQDVHEQVERAIANHREVRKLREFILSKATLRPADFL